MLFQYTPATGAYSQVPVPFPTLPSGAPSRLAGRTELDQYWLPYLRGEGTLDSALDRLVGPFAKSPK